MKYSFVYMHENLIFLNRFPPRFVMYTFGGRSECELAINFKKTMVYADQIFYNLVILTNKNDPKHLHNSLI